MNLVFLMRTAFPYGTAYSSRARNLTKLFCQLGYHVHVIAPKSKINVHNNEFDSFDISCDYVDSKNSVIDLVGIGTAIPYMKALKKYTDSNLIDFVVSSSMIHVSDHIRKFCKEKRLPYIIEQCEWFDKSSFKFGGLNPYYREHIKCIMEKNKFCNGVISISRLLAEHYASQNVPTIRIPTILDSKQIEYRVKKKGEVSNINLIFAGSLGNGKELLKPIFEALTTTKLKKTFRLNVYGPTREQIVENIDGNSDLINKLADTIIIHGRIPQNKVENVLREADFSIFLRPERRSSNAGFPTKLAESMMVGTPVVTNCTGDIGLYLKDGINGFILEDIDATSVVNVLNKINNMSIEAYNSMRAQARHDAAYYFDYKTYLKEMSNFLSATREQGGNT